VKKKKVKKTNKQGGEEARMKSPRISAGDSPQSVMMRSSPYAKGSVSEQGKWQVFSDTTIATFKSVPSVELTIPDTTVGRLLFLVVPFVSCFSFCLFSLL
jgi:hypothetical protein